MKLNVLSDLHLSRGGLPLPRNGADLVILAGDIARPPEAIAWAKSLARPVLYVPGNHEFYGDSLAGTVRQLKALAEGSQVRILHDEEVHIGGVRFLGSTLWTDFLLDGDGEGREAAVQAALLTMRDFSRIFLDDERKTLFTPLDAAALFQRHAAWLAHTLDQAHAGPTVVITHHAPSPRSIEERFRGSPMNACFCSQAEHLLRGSRAALWIHGHMHHSVDYVFGGTRVLSNPRGYSKDGVNENPQFDPEFVVEVG
jgi:Icc-related predicted phosphoesterase